MAASSTAEEKRDDGVTDATSPQGSEVQNQHDCTGASQCLDARAEQRMLRKLDAVLVPIIMIVYLTCFLDRTNIGNVRVAGMPHDIQASAAQFGTAISIFYATYVVFEPPWTLLLKRLTPRRLLTGLCLVWSGATVGAGFVQGVAGLYAARLVLGACEAGLFPALNLYLTMVYRRDEQAARVSYLFVCTAAAGAFGGLLAYALLKMDGVAGYPGWRWVFIVEGLCSLLVAPVIWYGLPNDAADASFLTPRERDMMKIRAVQRAQYMGAADEGFSWREVRLALRDPKLYLSAGIQFCQDILLYGFSTFLPSIIVSMGYTTMQAQYLSIPVYLFGGLCFLLAAFYSDRLCLRGPFILAANLAGILGYLIIILPTPTPAKFAATFLCAVAVYNGPGLNLTWLNVNVAPHYRRATAIGVQLSIGNSAGVVAGFIYTRPPYLFGNCFSVAALGVAQVLVVVMWVYLRRCNAKKQRIADGLMGDNRSVTTGDWELDFKYHL